MNERPKDSAHLDALLGALPRELTPARDLWPGVEAAIGDETRDAEAQVSRLPQEIAAPATLWPAISAEIRHGRAAASRPRRRAWLLLAACLVLAATGLLLFRSVLLNEPASPSVGAPTFANQMFSAWPDLGLFGPVLVPTADTPASFEAAHQTYRGEIAAVRSQRTEIEASLELYPDDPTLLALWLHTYETELMLIDEAGRILTNLQTGLRT